MNIFKGDLDNVIFLKKYSIIKFLPWLWLLLCFSLTVFKILFNIRYLLDSDLSNELYLGRVLAKEGHWVLSNNWFYSQDLRVLNMQIIFGMLFRLIDNFNIVRKVGTLIGYFIWLLSLYYLMYRLKMKEKFPIVAGFLLIPYSVSYEWIYLAGTTYIPFAVISFVSLALLIHCIELTKSENCKKRYIVEISLYLLAFISGLAGFRQLLILYIPMLSTSLFIYVYFEFTKKDTETINAYVIRTFIATLMSFAGCVVNMLVLSKIYKFATWSELKWADLSAEKFFNIINKWLYVFGYRAGTKVFSLSIFSNAFAIVMVIITASTVVYIKKNINTISYKLYIAAFIIFSAVIFSLFNLFLDFGLVDRYFDQIIVLVPIAVAIIYGKVNIEIVIKNLCVLILCLCAIVTGMDLYMKEAGINLHGDNIYDRIKMADFLIENGYESGYATYWNSGVMQELSNGKLKMYTLAFSAKNISQVGDYLQEKKRLTEIPEGKVFCIVKNKDAEQDITTQSLIKAFPKEHIIYDIDGYTVYGYNSYNEMSKDSLWDNIGLGKNSIKVSKLIFSTQCNSESDEIVSDGISSSVMYGPYMKMPVGKYNITYKYTSTAELPAGTIIGTADIYDTNYPEDLSLKYKTEILSDATEVTISNIELKEDCEMFEIRIFSSIAGVKPEEIIIQKLE